jgi:hypothetical protein
MTARGTRTLLFLEFMGVSTLNRRSFYLTTDDDV